MHSGFFKFWWPGAHSQNPWQPLCYVAFAVDVKSRGVIWEGGLKRVCNVEVTTLELVLGLEQELKDNNTREAR